MSGARIDHDLAVEDHPAGAARDGARGLCARRMARGMLDHVHAVDVPALAADQERKRIEPGTDIAELRIERRAHETAAQSDRELTQHAVLPLSYLEGVEMDGGRSGGEHPIMLDARAGPEIEQRRAIRERCLGTGLHVMLEQGGGGAGLYLDDNFRE